MVFEVFNQDNIKMKNRRNSKLVDDNEAPERTETVTSLNPFFTPNFFGPFL